MTFWFPIEDPMTAQHDHLGVALARYHGSSRRARMMARDLGVDPEDMPDMPDRKSITPKMSWAWLAERADRAALLKLVHEDYPLFPRPFELCPSHMICPRLARIAETREGIMAAVKHLVELRRIDLTGSADEMWFDVMCEAAAQGKLAELEAMAWPRKDSTG